MQFLRTILLRNNQSQNKEELYMIKRDFDMLKARVTLLEEENQKAAYAITELSACLQNIAVLVSDLSVDVNAFGLYLRAQIDKDYSELDSTKIFSLPDDDDDDGSGYLN